MPKEEAGAKRKQVDGDHPVTVSKKRAVETELKILDNKVEKKKSCRAPLEGESTSDDTEDDYVMVRPKRKQNKKAMKPHSITKSGQKIRTDTSKSGSSSGNSDGVSHLLPSTSLLKHPIESNNGETVSPPIPGVPANFNTVKCEVTERRAEVTKVKSIDSASLGWVAKMLVFFIGILLSALPFVRYCSNDALAAAALSGQPNLAKLMIIAGADVESRNVNGETLLLEACRLGNERAVQIYLNCGSLTEVLSKEGDTALQLALRMRKYKIANYLVEAGANVNAKNRNGESLLVQAIRLENYYISKFLISSGAAVNSKSMSGEEVLAMAFRTNQLETAKLLIQFGANVNSVTSDGVSVLGAAVLYDDSEKAKLLISAGADVEVVGKDGVTSPLMHAVMNGNKEIVTLLLAEGANTEVKNRVSFNVK